MTTVGPRDTLYTVARAHNVPIRDLIQWNGLDAPYDLKPGQVLRLPPSQDHVVASGETVYSVSRRYNVDMTELVRTNDIAPPYAISNGQHLKLPPPTLSNAPASLPPKGDDRRMPPQRRRRHLHRQQWRQRPMVRPARRSPKFRCRRPVRFAEIHAAKFAGG